MSWTTLCKFFQVARIMVVTRGYEQEVAILQGNMNRMGQKREI